MDQQTRLLIDVAHKPLLRERASKESLGTLKHLKGEWSGILQCEPELWKESLEELPGVAEAGSVVLVLPAPAQDLTASEIGMLLTFLHNGGSLLFVYNNQSLQSLNTDCLEVLGEKLGFRPKQYWQVAPLTTESLALHYTTAGVSSLSLARPAALEVLRDGFVPIAVLNEASVVMGCARIGQGRVFVSADASWLTDSMWGAVDNARFASNVARWLAGAYPLDCQALPIAGEVLLGRPVTFSIVLTNPGSAPLHRVRCDLESDCGTVAPVSQIVRFLPPGAQTWVQWSVTPTKLGRQTLRLMISLARSVAHPPLIYPQAATLDVAADVELDLYFETENGLVTQVEIDHPFRAVGQATWRSTEALAPLTLELCFPKAVFRAEAEKPCDAASVINRSWSLVGRKAGDYNLAVIVAETEQKIQRRLRVMAGLEQHARRVQEELVPQIEAEVRLVLKRIRGEFLTPEVSTIAFNVLTPREYVDRLFPLIIAEQLREALDAVEREDQPNDDLRLLVAQNITPTFSPSIGACVPFDPILAARIGNWDVRYRDELEANFLVLDLADETTLRQNLAAYLLHEKYGHGFFHTCTRVGRQLGILGRSGFLNGFVGSGPPAPRLSSPYPAKKQQEYEEAIQALNDSVILVDEGFAAWLELTALRRLSGLLGQVVHRRKAILLEKASQLEHVKRREYLCTFPPADVETNSPYREVCRRLDALAERLGPDYGDKCAVQAVLRAADIHLGISESDGTVVFGLSAEQMRDALLDPAEGDDARCDRRFRRIFRLLIDNLSALQDSQYELECYRTCPHPECPVDRMIRKKLGW